MIMQHDLFRQPQEAPVVAAYGAGVDSTAMLVEWVESGRRLDLVLNAETASEKPETDAYRDLFFAWLRDRGVRCEAVRYQPKRFKHWPPYASLDENCFTNGTLPSISFGMHSCSLKWKVEPQDAFVESWEPAVSCWAMGGKVIKLIGYDAGPRDAKRYAHSEGHKDPRYEYRTPLQEWQWDREACKARIVRAGLPVPVKSACYMCGASQPWEIEALGRPQLRRIVLLEARAAPRLRGIEGLWRKTVKGMRGATPRPGSMTQFIRERGLLPADEIDEIIRDCPLALVRFQERAAGVPIGNRTELRQWLALFDKRDAGIFDLPGGHGLYRTIDRIDATKEIIA